MKALLWDVDGTIAETERDGHRIAFNRAFEIWGLPWRWDDERYGELLEVTGGRERILYDMSTRDDAPTDPLDREALARKLHLTKNAIYGELVRGGHVVLRSGVRDLMEQCRTHGVAMAIATTTSRANVDVLLRAQLGRTWPDWFEVVVSGDDVSVKKPDPEVYIQALEGLGVAPRDAVAIEDSPNGAAAARAADIAVVITRSTYFSDADFDGAIAVGPGLHSTHGWHPEPSGSSVRSGAVELTDIAHWHRSAVTPLT